MNLSSIILLAAALLMQVGQGVALAGVPGRAEGHEVSCRMGCCAWMKECPCVEAPDSTPTPQTPVPLPGQGRDLVPQPQMTVEMSSDPTALSARNEDSAGFHPSAPRMIAVSAVPLMVLNCAFLI